MNMDNHIRILGILHIVYSSLAFLAGAIILILFLGVGAIISSAGEMPEPAESGAPAIIFIVGTVIAAILFIAAVPGLVGGIGLLYKKEWARILVLIVGFFDLLHVPLGTLLGVYTIWVLFNDNAIKLFRPATGT